ncbi:MAG TPA: hypothetical protein DEH02_20675 [Bacteroidales bacterium]|nr:MAG: hypothetical protein A2X01_16275 [Bacteroidetes bacterium GWF2_35_48]OFY94815.1 MAG: hypothetical protein A2491_14340 [Bacteroidetes bacterium RIFOXYC12_FULL_35_7]HBX53482.1 hypothetical protein [Bacteroidales bacterium]
MNFLKSNLPSNDAIHKILQNREMRIELLINRFRIIFFAALLAFDVFIFIFMDRLFSREAAIELLSYLFPLAGFIYIHKLASGNKYRPWVKYYTVLADLLGCTIYTLIIMGFDKFPYPITQKEFLLTMSFAFLFFHTLSLYRGYKKIIFFSSAIAVIGNVLVYSYAGYFFMMGIFTTIMILNFSFFYFWAGNKIIESVIANSQLNAAYDEIKEANAEILQQNEEISTQRDMIEAKSKIIEHKSLETTQSIQYALRIQSALLPDVTILNRFFRESFVLYNPKDIVSGDFYWVYSFSKNGQNEILFVAADCTGHGVPGAFMSIIGMQVLHTCVDMCDNFNDLLPAVNREIKKALHQTADDNSTRDGMDVALCSFNPVTLKLLYTGANRPLWLFMDGKFQEIKPTKAAIAGFTSNDQLFETHEFLLQKKDSFYIFSDGYADQFGGNEGKKLMTKRFKELLFSANSENLSRQKEILENAFNTWMGENEQVDDVLIIGAKV